VDGEAVHPTRDAPIAVAALPCSSSVTRAHALGYVQRTAQEAAFDVVAVERAVLRRDHGRDVSGYLVLLS
jgi:predicted TPR repeat methyltransferase